MLRGNVIDLAVAVIIGTAFTAIVTSLVTNIITPLIAAIVGKPDFSALVLHLNGGVINYGLFLNSLIAYLLQLWGSYVRAEVGCPVLEQYLILG